MLFEDLSVLIVDDEALIRMGAADMLSDAGAIYEAGDAAEALLVLAAHNEIKLVFTDVNMPGSMDGSLWPNGCTTSSWLSSGS